MKKILAVCLCLVACAGGSDCDNGERCLVNAKALYNDNRIKESVPYLEKAMKYNCRMGKTSDNLYHIHVSGSGKGCFDVMELYCSTLKTTKNNWYAMSCWNMYGSGNPLGKPSALLSDNTLKEMNLTRDEYWKDKRQIDMQQVENMIIKEVWDIENSRIQFVLEKLDF